MVKKCINPICIQWGLWRQSSGRNEEASGAPEVPFVLGEGTGDFLPPRFELGGGWQGWQGLQEGGKRSPPRPPGWCGSLSARASCGKWGFQRRFESALVIFRNPGRD